MNATAEKIADVATAPVIELRPLKNMHGEAIRGGREIFVDGKLWGKIEQARGGRYRSYRILQNYGNVAKDGKSTFFWIEKKYGRRGDERPIEFHPTTPDRYDRAIHKAKAVPLDDQLRGWIAGLLAEGTLRDPADVQAQVARDREAYRRESAAREAVANQELFERAGACLDPIAGDLGDNVKAEVVARIVEAMRWAQTK